VATATIPQTASDELPFDERFEALLERGRTEYAAERLAEAIETFAKAERLAEKLGDRRAVDRAFVNQCTSILDLERNLALEHFQRLREILMAGNDLVNSWLAAYDLARAYECTKEHRKGLFYARIALDRSGILGLAAWRASSHNQIGNFLLAESHFQEALDEYAQALELLPPEPSRRRALILTNMGYARVVLGLPDGLPLLYRSLRMLRSLGAYRDQIFPLLDLCFTLVEMGRHVYALRYGVRALALAEASGEQDSIKHALFLLGEAAQQAGDETAARERFEQLQKRYYPDASYLPEVLLTVDVRKLINLKA